MTLLNSAVGEAIASKPRATPTAALRHIPLELIGELTPKISVQDWIHLYEKKFKK